MGDPVRCLPKVVHPDVAALKLQHNPATLGASPESYRTWDAGRRATPLKILARARALAAHRDDHAPSASRRSAAQVQLSTILPTLTTLVLGYRHNRGSTVEERGQPQCEP